MNPPARYAVIQQDKKGGVKLTSRAGSTHFFNYEEAEKFCKHLEYIIVPLNSKRAKELLGRVKK